MTENNTPVLTREQARFLLDLELDTYAKKARAIAKAARELTFSDQWDEDNFHDAIRKDIGTYRLTTILSISLHH